MDALTERKNTAIELKHLRTLVQLRNSGSLVEAAEQLFMTQSALSHQLKELESRLPDRVFVRKSRPLKFTEVGRRLLGLADDVLPRIARAELDVQLIGAGDSGRLHMAIECHSCFDWLMPALDYYRERWPEVELDFSAGFTFEPLPALEAGDVDLVITSDPVELEGIEYKPLFVYESQIAVHKSSPLADKDYLSPKDFIDQTLITYPVERQRLDIFSRFLNPAKIQPEQVRHSDLTVMMAQLVSSNRGVCALPNWVWADYVEKARGQFVLKSAGENGIWPTLYAAVRSDSLARPYMTDFLTLAEDYCLKNLAGVRRS